MAASIGTIAAFTNGSDPSGSPTIDAGDDRKFALAVLGETDTTSLSVTVTVGGQAPTETLEYILELGSGGVDLVIYVYLWDEDAIAAMSGTAISWSDGITFSKISWTTFTVQDTTQDAVVVDDSSVETGRSVTITWPSNTDANGVVVALGVDASANRGPIGFDTGITSRQQYELADYAAGIGDGSGGGAVESSMTITNDDAADSNILGVGIFFAEVAATGNPLLMRQMNEGLLR